MSEKTTAISVKEFKTRLDANQIEYILDLRLADEFEAWRIEGQQEVETLNISQVEFVGEEEKFLDQLPKDKEIIIVCAHGGVSNYEAELLQEKGFKALSMEGGMDAWSILYETHKVNDDPDIYQIFRVAKGCMTHVLVSEGEAIVIDPIRHIEEITSLTDSLHAEIKYIFDTHLQADHISGGPELATKTGASYYICPVDAKGATYEHQNLNDQTEFPFGRSILTAIHSPGHTPGSVSMLLDEKFLFTGDTIMKTSIGRPDLGGMAPRWSGFLYYTLFERYKNLPDETVILPTHAASVREEDRSGVVRLTLGDAREHLELFKITDIGEFAKHIEGSLIENPDRYQDIRQVNLGTLEVDETKKNELEIGKNLCGMAPKE